MILVTGASGFIGSHLAEALLARGAPARALIRRSSSQRYLPRVEVAYGDLTTGHGLGEALAGVTAVIHAAGVTKALYRDEYHRGNIQATEMLARSVARQGIRLVHVSSLAAVGPSRTETPPAEDAEPRPLTHYGRSKLEAERIVRSLTPDAVIVRPPVVYGPRDTGVLQVLKPISRGWSLEIVGGPRWFSAIYVADLVGGLLLAAVHPLAAGRTYFLSHPERVCWSEFAAAAGRIMGRRPRVVRLPVAAARAVGFGAELWSHLTRQPGILSREKIAEAECRAWLCDPTRATRELGFNAATPIENGLARTLGWYKEAGWLQY